MRRKKPSTDKAQADGVPLPATVNVIPAHFNALTDQARIDAIAEFALTGKDAGLVSQRVRDDTLRAFKAIENPPGCPTDQEEWRQEVSRLLGIAVWKMAGRLATEASVIPLNSLPVAMAISLDKRLLLAGQPTSFAAHVNVQVTHESLLKRIRGTPQPPIEGKVQ